MSSFFVKKILNRLGNDETEILKKSNQMAAFIMAINTISQLYLKKKKVLNGNSQYIMVKMLVIVNQKF